MPQSVVLYASLHQYETEPTIPEIRSYASSYGCNANRLKKVINEFSHFAAASNVISNSRKENTVIEDIKLGAFQGRLHWIVKQG